MSRFKGEIGLLIVAIIWGSGFVASDIALSGFTPFEVMAIRFTISAICLSLVFHKHFKNITKREIFHGIIIGIFLYMAFSMQTIGLMYTTPSKNAFLTAVNVVIVPFIGVILYRRKIDIYGLIGAVLAAIGIGLISLNADLKINLGDMLTLVSAFGFAFHIFFTGEFLTKGTNPIKLTIIQMITASIISIIMLFIMKSDTSKEFSISSLIATIYLGLFSTTLAFLLQTVSQKYTTGTKAAILLSTESVFGTIFSVILLNESLTLKSIIGCVIIFTAIIFSEVKPKLNLTNKGGG